MAQQLAIARALISCPKMLILGAAMTELTRRGDLGVLFVEQHIGFAVESSQRYYMLESGRVTSSGTGGAASEADVRAAMAI